MTQYPSHKMKLKKIKPIYNKNKLLKIALREAISRLSIEAYYNSYASAYHSVMKEAKKRYK